MIFQTNGSSPPDSAETLGKGGQDLIGGANASETREHIFKGEAVMLGVLAGAGIFDEHKGKAEAGALAGGGLDARVGGDTGEDDRVDAAGFELLLQVGSGEGAPMPLGDEDVAGLETGGRSDLRRCGWQWLIAQVERLVDGKLHEVVEIDANIDDGRAVNAEGVGKFFGVFDDLCGAMRRWIYADDGILQVDENKCGLFRVELEFCHVSSLLKMFENRGWPRFLWIYNTRMPSISSNPVRVAPQQERSTRRLAGFLDAAAELFVEVGYQAATMTAIAERSGSSIGALYNYFPDKQSIAFTLVNQYSQELEAHWKPLMEQAEILTHAEFADQFIERITQFVQERPAYLSLLAAPIRFRRDPAARKASRIAIANAFQVKNPSLSKEQSLLAANLSLQIVRGMMALYGEADSKGKVLVVAEFKKLLTLYLRGVLSEDEASAK